MKDLLQYVPTLTTGTLGWLMLTGGVFLLGLARFLELFRPRR